MAEFEQTPTSNSLLTEAAVSVSQVDGASDAFSSWLNYNGDAITSDFNDALQGTGRNRAFRLRRASVNEQRPDKLYDPRELLWALMLDNNKAEFIKSAAAVLESEFGAASAEVEAHRQFSALVDFAIEVGSTNIYRANDSNERDRAVRITGCETPGCEPYTLDIPEITIISYRLDQSTVDVMSCCPNCNETTNDRLDLSKSVGHRQYDAVLCFYGANVLEAEDPMIMDEGFKYIDAEISILDDDGLIGRKLGLGEVSVAADNPSGFEMVKFTTPDEYHHFPGYAMAVMFDGIKSSADTRANPKRNAYIDRVNGGIEIVEKWGEKVDIDADALVQALARTRTFIDEHNKRLGFNISSDDLSFFVCTDETISRIVNTFDDNAPDYLKDERFADIEFEVDEFEALVQTHANWVTGGISEEEIIEFFDNIEPNDFGGEIDEYGGIAIPDPAEQLIPNERKKRVRRIAAGLRLYLFGEKD